MAEVGRFGSESINPNPLAEQRGVLSFATQAPTREKLPPFTPKKPILPKEPEKREKRVRKGIRRFIPTNLALRIGLATGAVAGVGVGGYETYQHTAGVHEEVPSGFTEHLKTFSENPAPVKRLDKIPPGRENIQKNLPPANTEGKLSEIKPYIQQVKSPGKDEVRPIPFSSVFTFRLEEEQPITEKIKVFTPEHPDGTIIEATTPRPPNVYMQGYVLAKEQNPDGSVLIALGIPKDEKKLFSNEDLDKPGVTQIDAGREGSISDVIVWLKMPNLADYQQPLRPQLGWSLPDKNGVISVMNDTTDPNQIFKYSKVGDAVYAGGYTPFSSNDRRPETLQLNYQNKKGKVPYEEAKQQYLDLASQNMATVRKMLEDVKIGKVSLREQLETKRYIINTDYLKFVVGN